MDDKRSVRVKVMRDAARAQRFLLTQPDVEELQVTEGRLFFDFAGDDDALVALLSRMTQEGLPVIEFRPSEGNLEDIFMRATKGRLQ